MNRVDNGDAAILVSKFNFNLVPKFNLGTRLKRTMRSLERLRHQEQ